VGWFSAPPSLRVEQEMTLNHGQTIRIPVTVRQLRNDLPDELWTKINIEFYKDSADAVFKALVE